MATVVVYTVGSDVVSFNCEADIQCKLCLMNCHKSEMFTLQDCGCSFCLMCMQQYVSVMVKEGNVMDICCPDGQCWTDGQVQPNEIEKLVETSIYDRYKRIRFLREVECDPCKTFCPKAGCETVCYVCVGSHTDATPPRPIKCQKCGLVFCCVCKNQWHPAKTCDEAMKTSGQSSEGGIPFQSPEDSEIKRCPICRIPIERNDGCAQMMCKHCKHVFCWFCLTSLDDDFMLRHYDKGPCKNKLGHSRASVVWHRTQVVGIFAGFGVLLLVASPFLLLAAPCILLCKCKACKCCDEDIDPVETITSS